MYKYKKVLSDLRILLIEYISCKDHFDIYYFTYIASIWSICIEHHVAYTIIWFSCVYKLFAIWFQSSQRPREEHTVICCTIKHEPFTSLTVQIFAKYLTSLGIRNLSYFLLNIQNIGFAWDLFEISFLIADLNLA